MEPENEKIDCPLCGAKRVISKTPLRQETTVHPAPKHTLGNYSMVYTGGDYDYSHVSECPKLVVVTHPKELLEFHLGQTEIWLDRLANNEFEDYQEALRAEGFEIEVKNIRKDGLGDKKEWAVLIFIQAFDIRRGYTGLKYLKTEGSTPEDAFCKLRQRLLCGEILETQSPANAPVEFWQMREVEEKLVFKKIYKTAS